jgi:hypothetical protein
LFTSITIALILSQVLVNPAPQAWESTPTLRPLSDGEAWDLTVSRSEAIGIGRIVDTRLLSPEPPPGAGIGGIYREAYELSFLPTEWFKGPLPRTTQTILCSRDRLHTRRYDTALDESIDQPVIVFLQQSGADWYLFESPHGYQGGVFEIDPAELDDLRLAVAEAQTGSSLDSLVARSDLVVVGTPVLGAASPCRAAGRNAQCSLLEIEDVLTGFTTEKRLVAYGMHGALPMERSIFFLRLTDEGVYETVPFYGGIMPIQGDRVDFLDMGFSEVDFEIRRIARVLATPEPIPPFTPTSFGAAAPSGS